MMVRQTVFPVTLEGTEETLTAQGRELPQGAFILRLIEAFLQQTDVLSRKKEGFGQIGLGA
ncbi:MAG: hypothetical protein ACK4Z6_05180 [Candidatus Methylomirabilales bacterium]